VRYQRIGSQVEPRRDRGATRMAIGVMAIVAIATARKSWLSSASSRHQADLREHE
jgi:hypothetical protein